MKKIFLLLLALVAVTSALYAQADQKLIDKANKGDADAMVILARCYENGAGVDIDSVAALSWYRKAAERGNALAWMRISVYHLMGSQMPKDTAQYLAIRQEWLKKQAPEAMSAMAVTYLNGTGVTPDTARAVELWRKAAQKGDSRGLQELGDMYYWGLFGVEKDQKKALKYWEQSLKKGDELFALSRLALHYRQINDLKKAWEYLDRGVKWCEPYCLGIVGDMYYRGDGVAMDERKAQQILADVIRKYPSFDHAYGSAGLVYYVTDDSTLRDVKQAYTYWQQGDALGDHECAIRLALAMVDEQRIPEAKAYLMKILDDPSNDYLKDNACLQLSRIAFEDEDNPEAMKEAVKWLQLGADKYNDVNCLAVLARIYSSEESQLYGNYYDLDKADYYYRKAAESGDGSICSEYAEFLINQGRYSEAERYYIQMAEQGDMEAYYNLARCSSAKGDDAKALDWLEKGDKKGDATCAEVLGRLYERGAVGNKPDYKKAEKYYKRAGTASALYQIGLLYLNGNLGKQNDKDVAKGIGYIEEAGNRGHIDAYLAMAYFYETGFAVGKIDSAQALSYYKVLADYAVPVGYFKVGQYYENGRGGLEASPDLALEYYQTAADNGHGEALCYLGDFHRAGQYLPRDSVKAFEYYRKADEAGEEIGTYYVARSYLEGCGVAVDTAAAVPYLYRAAAAGVGKADYLLGSFFDHARGGFPPNADSAFFHYLRGHENGSGDASYQAGVKFLQEDAYDYAARFIMTGANRGNVDAIVLLALMYQEGLGVDADPAEAYRLFELAAIHGDDSRAYSYMGLACLQGNGTRQDEILGKLYFDTAAAMGNTNAMFYLAICYMEGYGCEPDSLQGIKWLNRAIEGGNVKAMNLMGDICEGQEDFENAVKYYQMAVDAGSVEALCDLGLCYEKGQGVVLSFKKASELYRTAAENGSTRGCMLLANCYLEGMGVEQNANEAIRWLTVAADAGEEEAMYLIGSLYEDGENGVKKDLKLAKQWYKKAAAAGYEPAQAALNRL